MSTRSAFADDLFAGRTVVVTGANRGIGRAVADAFGATGARVIAHVGRSADTEVDGPADQLHADFTDRHEQDRFAREVLGLSDRIDVLVNNAGTMHGRFRAGELTDADYDHIVELNQSAPVRITRALLPALEYAADIGGDAAIINTVSISASTGGSPGSSIYSASKAFVSTWTRALARELAPVRIRCNAVSPGVIDTAFHERYSSRQKLENARRQIPLQRLGTAEDVAPAVLFFAAAALSGYVTGQVLEINGGQR